MLVYECQGYISNDINAIIPETVWETDLDWDTFYSEYETLRAENSIWDSLSWLGKHVAS